MAFSETLGPRLVFSSTRPPTMSVTIDATSEREWSASMNTFADANIYQSWAYGSVRWGERALSHVVVRAEDEVVAMAQLRILRPAGFPFGIAYLRWGPLCQKRGYELNTEALDHIADALHQEYVLRRGLHLEVLPNAFAGSPRARAFEDAFGRYRQSRTFTNEQYRTLVLDLRVPLEDLRKQFDKKWRNQLNAAERNGLDVGQGESDDLFSELCEIYREMRLRKDFHSGVEIQDFVRIQQRLPSNQRLSLFIAYKDRQPLAALAYSAMGESAIYLLGATSASGMRMKASYLLQWHALRSLQERNILHYDLGGIDPISNPGVHHFKNGMGGCETCQISAFGFGENLLSEGCANVIRLLRYRRNGRSMADSGTSGK